MRKAIKHVQGLALDVLFPRRCVGCNGEGSVWCDECAARFSPSRPNAACPFCGIAGSDKTCSSCARSRSLDGLTSIFLYVDPTVRRILTGLKYHGDAAYTDVIGNWIADRLSPASLPESFDVITPVPLHLSRQRSRGFNQAELISQAIAATLEIPHANLLTRTRKTAPQAKIAHAERRTSDLAGAFSPHPLLSKEGQPAVIKTLAEGVVIGAAGVIPSHILLCDDVFTTGATMDAAAFALKSAGAKFVWGISVAKG